ncbi:hypothetical protein [Spirosoma harenae]
MKIVFYTLIFLILALTGYSQKVSIPKKANRIEVTAALSDTALLDMISLRLETAGFFIDQLEKQKMYLISEYKKMDEAISIKVVVQIKGDIAVFSGQGEGEVLGYKYTNVPLIYKGSGSGVEKIGFTHLDQLVRKMAKSIGGASTIKYLMPELEAETP